MAECEKHGYYEGDKCPTCEPARCPKWKEDYRQWRGKRPTIGCARDLIEWDSEDAKLADCWLNAISSVSAQLAAVTAERDNLKKDIENYRIVTEYGRQTFEKAESGIIALKADRDRLRGLVEWAANNASFLHYHTEPCPVCAKLAEIRAALEGAK